MSFPIELPSAPGFSSMKWAPRSAVAMQPSEFSFAEKVYVWPGQQRFAMCDLPPMEGWLAHQWANIGYQLNGIEGTFYLHNDVLCCPVGNPMGIGLVKGGGQTGSSLITDGWVPNTEYLFRRNDMIQLGTRLYTITADVNSSVSGEATLSLWPKVRVAYADNLAIIYGADAKGVFRLTKWPEDGWDAEKFLRGFSFEAREVV